MTFHDRTNDVRDFNKLKIKNADYPEEPLNNYSTKSKEVKVYFRDIEKNIVKYILKSEAVVGCIAWMTSKPILKALAKKKDVKIIIQKEDFLRPDGEIKLSKQNEELRKLYNSLKDENGYYPPSFYSNSLATEYNTHSDVSGAVRCMGSSNSYGGPYRPRMHNKFMVFGNIERTIGEDADNEYKSFIPYAVWTGSFNFTANAGYSFENGLYITDKKIVMAYYKEWAQILGLSEELDWETPWVAPTVRIGS